MILKKHIRKVLAQQTPTLHSLQDQYVRMCSKEQGDTKEAIEIRIEIAKVLGGVTMLLKLLEHGTEQKS